MEYTILSGGREPLIKLVNEYIAAGWRPQGGVSESEYGWSQAMVRDW